MTDRIDAATLVELRAALEAGTAPGPAIVAVASNTPGPLTGVARALKAGQPVAAVAAQVSSGDPGTDLLVRALGVAERTGSGGVAAVDQAAGAARDEAALARLLRTRTTQARGTAVVLTAVPVAAWLLLLALDPAMVAFYATPIGAVTGAVAVCCGALGWWWGRRLIAGAMSAAASADPLVVPPAADRGRVLALAVPVGVTGLVVAGPLIGVFAAATATAIARRRRVVRPEAGGAAETAELVGVALAAGLSTQQAVAMVTPLAPPAARPILAGAARRLSAGDPPDAALAGSGLEVLGRVLAATHRWGAPAAPALRQLAAELRADRRAAAEAAAERVQLALVFPTTLLTLPSFVMAVVPPLLWTALSG